MDRNEAIKIIKNEAECVIRAAGCNRKCGSCDLLRAPSDILSAHYMAISALQAAGNIELMQKGEALRLKTEALNTAISALQVINGDCISRSAAIAICEKYYQERLRMADYCGDTVAWNIGGEIKGLPMVSPLEVHGYIKDIGNPICGLCSVCGASENKRARFCSTCGAKMDMKMDI